MRRPAAAARARAGGPFLAGRDRPRGREWGRSAHIWRAGGAVRPLPPGSGRAHAGSTAPPPGGTAKPQGQTWNRCEEHAQRTSAQIKCHPDSTSRWPRQPAAFDKIGHRQPGKRALR
jgi:hypothetical protein